jgi:hypothetical protein
LEEIESEYPDVRREIKVDESKEVFTPFCLSISQFKRIKGDEFANLGEESSPLKLLSDFIEMNPKVRNKDVGLGNLDENYRPISNFGETNRVGDVLREVKEVLPHMKLSQETKKDSNLFRQLSKYVDSENNQLSKNLGNLPIK